MPQAYKYFFDIILG